MAGHFIDRCPTTEAELEMIANMQQTLSPMELAPNLRELSTQLLSRYVRINYGLASLAGAVGGKPGLIQVIIERSPGYAGSGGGGNNYGTNRRVSSVQRVVPRPPAILNQDCILLDDLYEHISNEHVRQLFQLIYRRSIPTVEAMELPNIPFDERIPAVKATKVSQFNEDIPFALSVQII
jgi:hypothetical protein